MILGLQIIGVGRNGRLRKFDIDLIEAEESRSARKEYIRRLTIDGYVRSGYAMQTGCPDRNVSGVYRRDGENARCRGARSGRVLADSDRGT